MKAATVRASQTAPSAHRLARLCKALVLRQFSQVKQGTLKLRDGDEHYVFGGSCENATLKKEMVAEIHVLHPDAYARVLFGGTIGAGEAFMECYWDSPDIVKVIEFFLMNEAELGNMESPLSSLRKAALSVIDLLRFNSVAGAKKNIRAHYDLNNEFFSLFLDSKMMYSSAIFSDEAQCLESASQAKLDHICRRLDLNSDDHLIEIGSGWGGLAIHAATHYGCRVTTTTISNEQYEYARALVSERGLSDRVTVLNNDYRLLEGRYDKLVSVEMIEAVGHRYMKSFFHKCSSLLKEDGLALVQAITTGDRRFEKEKDRVDFIRKYIFPGGCLPSNAFIASMLLKHTNMHCVGYEDITLHYADTLAHWRARFLAALDEVKKIGFDDTFTRMWHFYLAYCEGGFRQRAIHTGQFLFAKPQRRILPELGVNRR